MAKNRSDADRRNRQCAKFARLIRIARLVMGNGRWGVADLAKELECSERTIFRDVEVLAASGVPIYFDRTIEAYRVTEGFRFGGLEPQQVNAADAVSPVLRNLLSNSHRLLREGEVFLETLRRLCDELETVCRVTKP